MNYPKYKENINGWLRLLFFLYADDMVVFTNTPHELQEGFNAIEKYCKLWELTINNVKTKVIVFRKRNYDILPEFYYSNNQLGNVNSFKYLGIIFFSNG